MSSLGKNVLKVLSAISEGIEQANALQQERKEKAAISHLRGEQHESSDCEICQAVSEAADVVIPKCKKHEFGECKANCRYRTGVVEDCTWEWHKNRCDSNCKGRRA